MSRFSWPPKPKQYVIATELLLHEVPCLPFTVSALRMCILSLSYATHFNVYILFLIFYLLNVKAIKSINVVLIYLFRETVKAICFGLVSSANYPDQWSDATIIRCKLHCERVSFCFAVRWRCVCCSLAWFPKRPSPSFLSEGLWFYVNRACFSNSRVLFIYISTSFIFQANYPYFRIWSRDSNHRRSRCATTWLPTSPSSGYSATHLPSLPETGLTLTVKALVRMTLTRNNHCERGFS